jgi:carbonic anhydrase/acetyltransferase-like protein (isoleucine patch superfamily)
MERPRIHPTAFVHPDAVLIGEVHLGALASVWPGAVIRADNGPIHVGARTSIQDGAVLHTQPIHRTVIGDDCVIGHLAHLEGCVIEDDVLVGSCAVVLERAICRNISFVAAGAVVTPGVEVPSGAMAVGVPARIRPGVVDIGQIHGNVDAYLRHVSQHRGSMQVLDLAACLIDGPDPGAIEAASPQPSRPPPSRPLK